jgi:hypothetical protein
VEVGGEEEAVKVKREEEEVRGGSVSGEEE